jgi:hypothetical protein
MDSYTTLMTFSYPSEAYVLRSLLESEGIICFLKDELNVQMYSLSSNAYGGVKLQVATADLLRAQEILKDNGYSHSKIAEVSSFWKKFDRLTERIPILKVFEFIYRFLILAAIAVFAMIMIALKISE